MGVIVLKNGKELTVTNDFFQQVKEALLLTQNILRYYNYFAEKLIEIK